MKGEDNGKAQAAAVSQAPAAASRASATPTGPEIIHGAAAGTGAGATG
jgi:hypothetical protein